MATNPLLNWFNGNTSHHENKRDGLVKETNPISGRTPSSFVYSSANKSEVTVEEVLSIPAAEAAIDIISSSIAQLPVELHKPNPTNKNGFVDLSDTDNRVDLLNNKVNNIMNGTTFKKKVVRDMLLWGASKSYIEYDNSETKVEAIYPLDMEHVNTIVQTDDGYSFYGINYLTSVAGEKVFYDDLLLSVLRDSDDGITGRSVKDGNADVFQTALNQSEYERALMANGAVPTSVLKSDKKISDDQMVRLKNSLAQIYSGTKNAGKTMVLENGLDYQRISLDPTTLKYDENKKAILSDIARVFNIPESMINSGANKYNSLEQNNLWFLQFSLMPLIINFESALNNTLLSKSERKQGLYFKFNVNKLMQATVKDNNDIVIQKFGAGLITNFEAKKALGEHIEDNEEEYFKLTTGTAMFDSENNVVTNPNNGLFMDMNNKSVTGFSTQSSDENTISDSEGDGLNEGIGTKGIAPGTRRRRRRR